MANGFTLSFEVEGEEQLKRAFSRFGEYAQDLRDEFKEIARDFHETVEQKQFATEGAYGAGGWAPLSPGYAAWKGKNYPGMPILQLTGRLMESLTGKTSDTIEEIGRQDFRLGTKAPYAIYHQKGTGRMPARPIIKLTEDDKRRWTKIIHIGLVKRWKGGK